MIIDAYMPSISNCEVRETPYNANKITPNNNVETGTPSAFRVLYIIVSCNLQKLITHKRT